MKTKMNKKGSMMDLVYIMAVFFVFGIILIISGSVLHSYKDNADTLMPESTTHSQSGLNALKAMDYAFLFLLVGSTIVTILLAFQLKEHPAFFFISFLFLCLIVILSATLSNVFTTLSDTSFFSRVVVEYGIAQFILRHYPVILTVLGLLVLAALYVKEKTIGQI